MPLTTVPLPYGLRDVRITPYTDTAQATTLGTGIDLPNARTFSFSESEDFEELRGDDKVIAVRGKGGMVEYDLEAGGYSFEAIRAMYGGTITETGTTPAQKKSYTKKVTDARPYFKVEGQSISDSGGDFHCVIDRCKATGNLEGEMSDGSWWLTSSSGKCLPSQLASRVDVIYEFVQNETAVAPV